MTSCRYCCTLTLVLGFFLLFASLEASQTQSSEPEGQLQLFFYATDGPSYFIVVEKKHQKLKLFEQKDGLKILKEFTCATGENPGTKKTSGDARTPEGIYHITEIYEDKRITVFGSRAFHLDYPNAFDVHAGHYGDGIFIHGTNKKLNPNSTNGCITLNNSDLDELAPYLAIHTIPVIVLDSECELSLGANLLLEKNSSLFQDVLEKISFNPVKIPVENIKTLTYFKLREQMMVSINYKILEDKLTQYTERKRAYLSLSPSGNWRTLYAVQTLDTVPTILALRPTKNEQAVKSSEFAVKTNGVAVKANTQAQKSNESMVKATSPTAKSNNALAKTEEPGIIAGRLKDSKPSKPSFDKEDELLAFVEKWRTAWASKDIDAYISCYSPSFKSGNMNKEEWRAKKIYLNQKYKFIAIQIHNISIEWTSTGANVSFQQTYKSDQLQNNGTKTLHLINWKNRWMIENEII
jgi:murein L,D-transpeptidase YafK